MRDYSNLLSKIIFISFVVIFIISGILVAVSLMSTSNEPTNLEAEADL